MITDDALPAELAGAMLAQLRRDPVRTVEGIRLSLASNDEAAVRARFLADLDVMLSANNDPVTPRDPAALVWCAFCGAPDDDAVPGPDGPGWPQRYCRDEDECVANRARWYPPDPARSLGLASAGYSADEAAYMRLAVELAFSAAAEAYLAELSQRPDSGVLALSAGPGSVPPVPPRHRVPAWEPWSHVLGRDRGHTVGGRQGATLEGGDRAMGQQPNQPARPTDSHPRRGRRRRR